MYLAVWSPRVWSALGTPEQIYLPLPPDFMQLWPFLDQPENAKAFGGDVRKLRDAAQDTNSGFSVEKRNTELFRSAVPHVARALANIATYMIFDDHDVTDDWNLNKKWTNRVYSKPFGRQLVRNAVMAYAVFQGWGNDPVAFETGKNKDLLDEVEKLYGADAGPYPVGSTDRADTLAGVTAAAITELPTWNYIVRTPKAQIIVLDTRTRRKFTGQGYLPADLVGLNREAQLPAGPTTDGREVTFVISAAPVFGPDMVEQLAWPLAQVMIDGIHFGKGLDAGGFQQGEVGRERYDAEGWSTNELAREELFKRLATYPAVVLLGGDVHFAYTAVLDYYKKGAAGTVAHRPVDGEPVSERLEAGDQAARTTERVFAESRNRILYRAAGVERSVADQASGRRIRFTRTTRSDCSIAVAAAGRRVAREHDPSTGLGPA
jgi:hypothetical protein